MKKPLTAIAFGVMTLTGLSALAQSPGGEFGPGDQQPAAPGFQQGQDYGPGPGMRGGRGDPAQRIQRRLERMSEYLELSDTQRAQIKSIFEEQHAKRITLREETQGRISAVLDEQQRGKLEQMRANRGKGGRGGWGRRDGEPGYGGGPGS